MRSVCWQVLCSAGKRFNTTFFIFAFFCSKERGKSFISRNVMTLGIIEPRTDERPPGTELLVDDAAQSGSQIDGADDAQRGLKRGKGKVRTRPFARYRLAKYVWYRCWVFAEQEYVRCRKRTSYSSHNHLTILTIPW